MLKYLKTLVLISFIFFVFCSCGKKEEIPVTAEPQTIIETDVTEAPTTGETVAPTTSVQTTKAVAVTDAPETTAASTYGESELTNDADNKFIKAVTDKYGISADGLICSYSKNGNDNNFIFQFDGSTDENGKHIRTADKLKYVYSVTADCKTVCRTGGYTGNDGCSLVNGLGVFMMSKQVLIPNIQDQINALP